jgi:hypothetical protein
MSTPLRVVVGLSGLMFGLQALGWIFDPARAAEGLGMPLLDGLARSTQVGDFSAFFVSLSVLILLGAVQQRAPWLWAGALMLGSAAVLRTLAWAAHGADLATTFIVIELAFAALLAFAAWRSSEPA